MKDMHGQKIDELFRQKLNDPDIPFEEERWLDMQRKLTDTSKQRYFFRGLAIGSAAALLLVVFGWWMLAPGDSAEKIQLGKKDVPKREMTQPIKQQKLDNNTEKTGATLPRDEDDADETALKKRSLVAALGDAGLILPDTTLAETRSPLIALAEFAGAGQQQPSFMPAVRADMYADSSAYAKKHEDEARSPEGSATEARRGPGFILSITAAPDYNGVRSFSNKKAGFSGGITGTLVLSRKLSVTTGAILAKKPYDSPFSAYKPSGYYKFNVDPVNVSADCRVLDIPLNLNYTFLTAGKNTFGVTAGASSYFMLKEDYQFDYKVAYPKSPRSYQFRNENSHYFGAANVALSYERKVGSTIGVAIQPYLKVPLTGIGYGNVKLLSAGAAVSLNMNMSDVVKRGRKP